MTALPDDDQLNVTQQAGKDAGIVIRISRTAGGTRTWTVGAQLASSADAEKMLPELLAIDDTLAMLTSKPTKIGDIAELAHYGDENGKIIGLLQRRKPKVPTLGAQLADSLIVSYLQKEDATRARTGAVSVWSSTAELIEATKMPRSSLRYHLTRLARAGVIEKQAGRGGPHTNLYRLATTPVTTDGKPTGAHK